MTRVFIVDGMLSGTGVRDALEGGYCTLSDIGVSTVLQDRISNWLESYALATYRSFSDKDLNAELDKEGLEIARILAGELQTASVKYFSNAQLEFVGPVYGPQQLLL